MAAAAPKQAKKPKVDVSQIEFVVDVEAGKVSASLNGETAGFVEVSLDKKTSILHIKRTVTEEKFRGNGIAGLITKEVFDYASKQQHRITSDCWYTDVFLRKPQNAEYSKLFQSKI